MYLHSKMEIKINYSNGSDIPNFDNIKIKKINKEELKEIDNLAKKDLEILENIIYLEEIEKNITYIQNKIDYYMLWDYLIMPNKIQKELLKKIQETYNYILTLSNKSNLDKDIKHKIWKATLYLILVQKLLDN